MLKGGGGGGLLKDKPLATIKTTIIFFVCPFKCLNKHCFYFLLGNWKQCISKILDRQTKSIMVFLIVAN